MSIVAQAYADAFFGPRPNNVAWIITKDHLFEPDKPVDACNSDEAGTAGPREAPDELLARLHKGEGIAFRMYDDDGELYYDGRILALNDDGTAMSYPDCGEEFFRPLEDFGTPNAGCTEIRYRNTETGKWDTL